jgi:hypothetical protein
MAVRKTGAQWLPQKTCKEIAALVSDYLHDNLEARLRRQFEEHLKICPDCIAFLKTFRKTVSLIPSVRAEDMPDHVRQNILTFLKSRARRRRARA